MAEKTVFTIPAGMPFAKILASHIIKMAQDKDYALSEILILLPSRRACRAIQHAFLQLSAGKPLLLPKLRAIGDVDEEELSLHLLAQEQDILNLPPAMSALKRQILLARAIHAKEEYAQGFDKAMALASELGHFIDQIHTESLDIADLAKIVPEEFAEHWQITLDFLKILSAHWPQILADNQCIDFAQRRDVLIRRLSTHWQSAPPARPVIAAGTTGSIPSVAELLRVIAGLPMGQVILPGLDQDVDEESWDLLQDDHPQYGLKNLLAHMQVPREDVRVLASPENITQQRGLLAMEMMRPPETSSQWQTLKTDATWPEIARSALRGVMFAPCDTPEQEASMIAMMLREQLENPDHTAAVITPDRHLARRIASICGRWGIEIDDSAGFSLKNSKLGTFMNLLCYVIQQDISPAALLAVLKHDFCYLEHKYVLIEQLETQALRGLKPAAGFDGLRVRLHKVAAPQNLHDFLDHLERITHDFIVLKDTYSDFSSLVKAHLTMAERLCPPEILWAGEAGQQGAQLFADLMDHAGFMPRSMSFTDYANIMRQYMATTTVRPKHGMHPRLAILGQLEARLVDADLVVMAGLNEGIWPPEAGHDPWMSRPMQAEFGLPLPERKIGLAAHDFVQAFCQPRIVMTRSLKRDGAPTIPARWLRRMDTVLSAVGLCLDDLQDSKYKDWIAALEQPEAIEPTARPAPTPPPEARPKALSITQIETWLQDPYAIYAREILKLREMDPLEQAPQARDKGNVLHNTLEEFIRAYPDALPPNAFEILREIARAQAQEMFEDQEAINLWWPRFVRMLQEFLQKERAWRAQYRHAAVESRGEIRLGAFTLRGKADRIDRTIDTGAYALIDYKSGGTYSAKSIENGRSPQLGLEALMLKEGGFEEIAAGSIAYLGYWILTGGKPVIEKASTAKADGVDALVRGALEALIQTFADPNTPYLCLPNADNMPRFNAYTHLERAKEWAAFDDQENNAEEAA